MSHIDDRYNRLSRDIGNDLGSKTHQRITELYSFHCGNCGYRNIHDIKEITCGCGKELQSTLVYHKVGDTVIYDTRRESKKKGRK